MARAARDNRLDTRTQRLKLEPEKRYFLNIGEGVSLCYRRGKTGAGVWFCRTLDAEGKQRIEKVAEAVIFRTMKKTLRSLVSIRHRNSVGKSSRMSACRNTSARPS